MKEKNDYSALFSEDKILDYAAQISSGLNYMYNQNELGKQILHTNITAKNVFVTKDGQIKLTGFGFKHRFKKLHGLCLDCNEWFKSPYSLSPDSVQNLPYDSRAEIWSLGVLLYKMCTFEYPFKGENIAKIVESFGKFDKIPDIYSIGI